MEQVIEGKARWEGTRLIESLQRWRVPLIVCKEIDDLLSCLNMATELIKSIRADYPNPNNLTADSLLLENLLELVFRVLVYFSEIPTGSPEASKIRS
jgi:hypothetical protein